MLPLPPAGSRPIAAEHDSFAATEHIGADLIAKRQTPLSTYPVRQQQKQLLPNLGGGKIVGISSSSVGAGLLIATTPQPLIPTISVFGCIAVFRASANVKKVHAMFAGGPLGME